MLGVFQWSYRKAEQLLWRNCVTTYPVLCPLKFSLKELPQLRRGRVKTPKGGCTSQHPNLLAWLFDEMWLMSTCSLLREKNGDRDAGGASLFICVIIVSLYFHLDLTEGWKSPRYQEQPSFVQKDDTVDKRKLIHAFLQINGSVQSIQ